MSDEKPMESEKIELAMIVLSQFVRIGANTEVGITEARMAASVLIAEVRRLKAENENLAGELRDEKAYAKELRDNMGQAGIY